MPWERLVREWLIYAAIMVVILLVFFRGSSAVGAIAGVLISGPLYLAFGSVLAKFGYTRKTLRELRAESSQTTRRAPAATPDDPRDKPAPTSRTAGSGQRPQGSARRRRR